MRRSSSPKAAEIWDKVVLLWEYRLLVLLLFSDRV